jgi:hypothetical protein
MIFLQEVIGKFLLWQKPLEIFSESQIPPSSHINSAHNSKEAPVLNGMNGRGRKSKLPGSSTATFSVVPHLITMLNIGSATIPLDATNKIIVIDMTDYWHHQ